MSGNVPLSVEFQTVVPEELGWRVESLSIIEALK